MNAGSSLGTSASVGGPLCCIPEFEALAKAQWEDDMTSLWTRTRVWVANRLLDLGLIEAAKWVAPKRWGRP